MARKTPASRGSLMRALPGGEDHCRRRAMDTGAAACMLPGEGLARGQAPGAGDDRKLYVRNG